jgi:hypothetical protein
MEEHFVDVRDPDTKYFERVRVWLDRATDRYHLPEESAARMGEPAEDGTYLLLDGTVVAEPVYVGADGDTVKVWTVPVHRLVTRPASPNVREFL